MNIIDNVVVVDCLHEMFWGIQKGRLLWRVGGSSTQTNRGRGQACLCVQPEKIA